MTLCQGVGERDIVRGKDELALLFVFKLLVALDSVLAGSEDGEDGDDESLDTHLVDVLDGMCDGFVDVVGSYERLVGW